MIVPTARLEFSTVLNVVNDVVDECVRPVSEQTDDDDLWVAEGGENTH